MMTRPCRVEASRLLRDGLEEPMKKPALLSRSAELERDAQDQGHDSDRRGEHRYPDAHQRPAERQARQERDDLKGHLARRKNHKG